MFTFYWEILYITFIALQVIFYQSLCENCPYYLSRLNTDQKNSEFGRLSRRKYFTDFWQVRDSFSLKLHIFLHHSWNLFVPRHKNLLFPLWKIILSYFDLWYISICDITSIPNFFVFYWENVLLCRVILLLCVAVYSLSFKNTLQWTA